ncbi:unnamed protein product [Dibothriocephalus latus]|uniref:Nuclear receptor domain-containing protein n=1 Tax=Dibothriocephalus latus TaxID=60516 RepID=A0A3P7NL30_DIBLA|nr:unnamed protein product [Dibothriocephalus latus]
MTMRVRKNKEGAENPEAFAGRELRTVCPMGGRCKIEGAGRGKCPHCRFRKCLDLGMSLTRECSLFTYSTTDFPPSAVDNVRLSV